MELARVIAFVVRKFKKAFQMYKIYINDTPLILASAQELDALPQPGDEDLRARYPGKAKFLLNYIDMLEKSGRFDSVTLYSDDFEGLQADFDSHFEIVEAAGGLVCNSEGATLLIYRRGSWDLPKGKIDPGESPREAALREVREETGLRQLTIEKPLPLTYHTYRDRDGGRILKRTYWFAMRTEEMLLIPEEKEDIELAVWMTIPDFFAEQRVVYGNIRELLEKASVS